MLLVLLHDVCTICTIASYEIGTMILLIAQLRLCSQTSIASVCISFFRISVDIAFLGFFAINGVTIESWLQLFLTVNLAGIGDLRLQPRIFNMDFGLQLGPTHLSLEIVKFLQLPNSY